MPLNPSQQRVVDMTDGLIVVDAGPGTGKTSTVVERYVSIISKPDITPRDVLLMTFTNNAGAEMRERINKRLSELGRTDDCKLVMARTFDSFCNSVVMDHAEMVSGFFRTDHVLTRAAKMSDNETMNREYFMHFLDGFLIDHHGEYGQWNAIASENQGDLMRLISKLMSMGIVPLKTGWFGDRPEERMLGDSEKLLEAMMKLNHAHKNGLGNNSDMDENDYVYVPRPKDEVFEEEDLREAACEDRSQMLGFIHDVFYEYIVSSISDNRLTFQLVATFAFVLLYKHQSIRERNSFKYVMIDEFQDTNANQMMISMMVLSEPNLCVVGDWKQGIYGFRFVSIDNILHFEERLKELRRFLNDDLVRVRFRIDDVVTLPLEDNYRSSQEVIDLAFKSLSLKGFKDENVDVTEIERKAKVLKADRDDIGGYTHTRFVESEDGDARDTVRAIEDYLWNDDYRVTEGDSLRRIEPGDIAVMCRTGERCREVLQACIDAGIPAFLQGDLEIMSTREGKLALAWLRFVNNESDPRGYVPILADMNYSLYDIMAFKDRGMPEDVLSLRNSLRQKRRRITELLTMMFDRYGLDNDITQAVITTLATAHRGSLMTLSDVITMIDDDIESKTTYKVENSLDESAVTIMTMHKSKGLEYPVVIAPFINTNTMPSSSGDRDAFIFNRLTGIRCTKEVGVFDGYSKMCGSWRTKFVRKAVQNDYDEERRLMFVTLSRAKQYVTLIASRPSTFMKGLSEGRYSAIPDARKTGFSKKTASAVKPDVSGYSRGRMKMGVHEIMDFGEDGTESDEVSGKGKQYGTLIHKIAYSMCRGFSVDESEFPELTRIRDVLNGLEHADLHGETDIGYPVPGTGVTLRGTADLLAVFPDRVEVHDYKTDVTRKHEDEYKLQLSVYAHAAESFYGRRAVCVIDYLSQGDRLKTEAFDPLPVVYIQERVERVLSRKSCGSCDSI